MDTSLNDNWNWVKDMSDDHLEWYLRIISDDIRLLPEDKIKVLLWEAANRVVRVEHREEARNA